MLGVIILTKEIYSCRIRMIGMRRSFESTTLAGTAPAATAVAVRRRVPAVRPQAVVRYRLGAAQRRRRAVRRRSAEITLWSL